VLAQGFVRVVTTGALIARHAGHLLADADRGSELAVHALVVATTIRLGGGLILTHDPADLKRLSARHPAVRIVTICRVPSFRAKRNAPDSWAVAARA
jgi:hypothetical protein